MNEAYIKQRDKMIPFAEKYADRMLAKAQDGSNPPLRDLLPEDYWNRTFHNEMNRLAKIHEIDGYQWIN